PALALRTHRPVGRANLRHAWRGPALVRGGACESRGRHPSGRRPRASLPDLAAPGRPLELLLPPFVLARLAGYAPGRTRRRTGGGGAPGPGRDGRQPRGPRAAH